MTSVVAFMLVTSLSVIGWISVWALHSNRHWLLRTSIVVLAVFLPWPIPAFEVLIAFATQSFTITVTVLAFRWIRLRRNREKRSKVNAKFSIRTILIVTTFLALATAVFAQLPSLGLRAWTNVAVIGALSGTSTLLGLWVSDGRNRRVWLRLLFATIGCVLLAYGLAQVDFAFAALSDVSYAPWPPLGEESMLIRFLMTPDRISLFIAWTAVFVGIMILQVVVSRLIANLAARERLVTAMSRFPKPAAILWNSRCALLLMSLLVILPPSYIYLRLLTPIPIPEAHAKLEKNGWDYFVEAGKLTDTPELAEFRYDVWMQENQEPTRDEISTAVASLTPVFDIIDRATKLATHKPLEYGPQDIDVTISMAFRKSTEVLELRGRLFEMEGRFSEAVDSYLQAIRLGFAVRRGGYIIDLWIGEACATDGMRPLYRCLDKLSNSDRLKASTTLAEMEANAEPLQSVLHREQIFVQRSDGWRGHFWHILDQIYTGTELNGLVSDARLRHDFERCVIQLLRVELAIHSFHANTESFPKSLDQLVPDYLDAIPLDPCSPISAPLRFRKTREGAGYELYSVGVDGVDNNGYAWDGSTTDAGADIRLDSIYAIDKPPDEP